MPVTMPKQKKPASIFGERLVDLRKKRGLSQVELAQKIGSTQRAISYYEVVAAFPPAEILVQIAKALRVSTDELLGLRQLKETNGQDRDHLKLWRKFRKILDLPEKDQRAISRMIQSLASVRGNGNGRH
jgi:transcriptional regulator with XRE-family HTH domain